MDIQKENNLIREAFNDEAHSRGFCLDQEWSDCENPYLDGDTNLAFDFFKGGWQAAKAKAIPDGFVVVPAQCPDPDFADMLFDELSKNAIGEFGDDLLIHFSDIDEEKIWGLMLEAAQEQAND